MAVLQMLQGPNPGQIVPLDRESAVLGRNPECDIVLESETVSRQHARIVQDQGDFYIEDMESRNGTLLNGKPVAGRQPLQEHDRVAICDIQFVFFKGLPTELPAAPRPVGQPMETAALLVDDDQRDTPANVMSKVDVSSGHKGLKFEVNPEAKLRALIGISRTLGRSLALSEVLPKLLDGLFTVFTQADRGFIVLRDPATSRLVPMAIKHRRPGGAETARISRTIINGVMAAREAVLSANATEDSRFDMAESIVDFNVRSMMCVPLIDSQGQALGVIQIDTVDQRKRFSREDLDVLASVACQAAFAVENAQLHEMVLREQAMKHELNIAHDVMRGFLPSGRPRIEHYEFFDFYEPANQLGGDYYDYIPLSGGRLAVVVADVAGKGIPASLLMAKLSSDARYCLASEPSPAEAVGRLNRAFCASGWDDRFVTFILALLDPKRHEVTLVNAGHLPPLWRHGGEVRHAVDEATTRLPLGVECDVAYVQTTLSLAAGDSLTLYTDGITEAMNEHEDLYGFERLSAQAAAGSDYVGDISRGILADVKRFVGAHPQADDMCLVSFGRES